MKGYDDKYHGSNVFTLYPRSSIGKLLDDLTASLIQNREDNKYGQIRGCK